MLPERATTSDYDAIIATLANYWGERDMRARHHPMFIHEFGETALVMRDASGGVAAYLFGFLAPTRVGYVHLVGVRADSRRAGLGRRLYREFETLARHRGATALKAITTPTNHDSIAFHRALDMSATEVPDYSGPGQPRVVFWRNLSQPPRHRLIERVDSHDHWTIRDADEKDIAAVLALWTAAGSLPSVTDSAEGLSRLLATDPQALLVAESAGIIVGSLVAAWDGWRGSFYRLAVAPEHRRKGLARMLLGEGERRLRKRGAIRLTAIVTDDEKVAMAFWQAADYERQKHRARFVRHFDA